MGFNIYGTHQLAKRAKGIENFDSLIKIPKAFLNEVNS